MMCEELTEGIKKKHWKITKGKLYQKPIMGIKSWLWIEEETCPFCGKECWSK